MTYDQKTALSISLVAATFIGLMIFLFTSLAQTSKKWHEEQNQAYQECKEKTGDLEWCYKNFDPTL